MCAALSESGGGGALLRETKKSYLRGAGHGGSWESGKKFQGGGGEKHESCRMKTGFSAIGTIKWKSSSSSPDPRENGFTTYSSCIYISMYEHVVYATSPAAYSYSPYSFFLSPPAAFDPQPLPP